MTARKTSAQEKLVFSSDKHTFGLLFENHPVPMFIYDLGSLAFLNVNDAMIEKFGYSRDEFQGLTLKDILAAQERERLLEVLKKERPSLQYSGRWRNLFKDGSTIDGEVTSHTLMYDGREAALVLVQDAAKETMNIEEALAISEPELRALFAAMQDAVMVIDRDGRYRKIAPTNPDLLVLPPQELIGKNLRDVFPAEQADTFINAIHQVLSTQQPERIEYELQIGESMLWFATYISPLDADNTLWVARDITERKQAEAALRESEERFHSLFDHMMDGVYRSTHAGKFVDINPAMVEMFGYSSREEMLEVDIKKELYFLPEERGSHVLDTGQEETEVYRMRRKDGSEIWVEDHGTYVHDDQGGLKYHEGILRDITERKQVEEELRRSEERFRSLYDNSTIGLYRTTPDGRILMSNPAGIRMLGYDSFEEISAHNLEDAQYEPGYSRRQFREKLEREGTIHGLESKWLKKDGSIIIVRESAKVFRDGNGNILYYDGSFEDITARKQAEDSLLKLNKAVDTSTEAIFLTDTQGIFTYINPGFTALYGFTAEELIGKTTPRIIKSGLLGVQNYIDYWAKLTSKQEVKGELQNKRKDGKIIYIEGSATPIVDDADRIIGYLGIQRDITERKLSEEALRDSESSLQAVLRSTADGILAVNSENKVLYANERFTEMWQIPQSVMASRDDSILLQYILDQLIDPRGFLQMVQELYKSDKESLDMLYFKNGRVFERLSRPMQQGTEPHGRVWSFRDITERKLAEEALHTAEANYRSIYENATVGIYQSVPQGVFLNVNTVMAQIFGYDSPQEMVNSVVSIADQYYVEPAARQDFERLMIEQGEVREFISQNYRKNGEQIWVQENARAVKDAQGQVLYYEGFVTDITERKQAEDELYRAKDLLETAHRELQELLAHTQLLARTDGLTGLYNFRYFFEIASYEFNAAVRYQRPFSIIIFDTDNLKKINDTFGHSTGDKMLMGVAQTASSQVRGVDSLARYGGDEFVIVLPQASALQAYPVAERIRASVAALRIETEKGPLAFTLSIGVAELCMDPLDESLDNIVQRADKALYEAKAAGRNRTVIYSTEK